MTFERLSYLSLNYARSRKKVRRVNKLIDAVDYAFYVNNTSLRENPCMWTVTARTRYIVKEKRKIFGGGIFQMVLVVVGERDHGSIINFRDSIINFYCWTIKFFHSFMISLNFAFWRGVRDCIRWV